MNDILYNVLEAVLIAAVAAVARYLIPYVREKLAESRYAWLVDVIDAAVRGAEQIFGGGQGEAKKAAVVRYVNEWLTNHNVNITVDQVNQLIEAAVNVMNTEQGKYDQMYIGDVSGDD